MDIIAPPSWRTVDFISDLHLQVSEPQTAQAFRDYLARTRADAIFILGDLFEVWVGDDAIDADDEDARFERSCIDALHAASTRCALHFLHGNRDFLLGQVAAQRAGMKLLDDPTTLIFAGERRLLSHGDALCLDDREYQIFRAQVRTTAWQQHTLAQPLAQRRAMGRALRAQSEAQKKSGTVDYADADLAMTLSWLEAADAMELIHGHTHKPADHELQGADGERRLRRVLSDWDLAAQTPRAEVLRLTQQEGGARVSRLPLAEA